MNIVKKVANSFDLPEENILRRVDIDLALLHQRGMVTPDGERTQVAQEFRFIKRPLLQKAFHQHPESARVHGNLIMVTSALPQEGKTFCTINLAISIAMELDYTVLLVDANVVRPSVLNVLGVKSEIGLMDLLLKNKTDLSEVILRTNVNRLNILPAGKNNQYATELLASQTMSNLLEEMANRYADRIVIFDSPPLLSSTESLVLASQMGQIVLVVEAEKTTRHAVKTALEHVKFFPNVGLVYNKSRPLFGKNNHDYYF